VFSLFQDKLEGKGTPLEVTTGQLPRPRLAFVVYFRAIAIVLIVAGHSYGLAGIQFSHALDDAISSFLKGATALFVFISGFLFDYVYSGKYRYRQFLEEKARRLLIPYLVLTFIAQLVFWELYDDQSIYDKIFRDLILGDTFQAYWYVPFILVMFTIAPLHRGFMRLRSVNQIWIILALMIIAGFVQRPINNDNVFQSIIFYMPIYLSGLFVSVNREALVHIKNNRFFLLLITVGLVSIQGFIGQNDNMQSSMLTFQRFELMGFQKLSLSLLLIALFSHAKLPPSRMVNLVAETSFAIFFLHPFLLEIFSNTKIFLRTDIQWLDLALATITIVGSCILITLALKLMFKSSSKYIIGY
jgi:hypothetical protein